MYTGKYLAATKTAASQILHVQHTLTHTHEHFSKYLYISLCIYVCECVCMYSHRLAIVTIHTNTPTHSDVRELTFELFFMCIIIIIIVSINIVLLSSSTFCAQISVRCSFQPHMRMDRLIYISMYSHI